MQNNVHSGTHKYEAGSRNNVEILVMTSAYARPHRLSGWRWGGRTASANGSVRAISLGGKSRGSVTFGNPRFPGGKSYQ